MQPIIPIYHQIKQTIRNWIINKEFGPGEKLPSADILAKHFNVSRLTVRQAIFQLVQEGFLSTRRGKGTFVTGNENLLATFSLDFMGFIDSIFYQAEKSKTKHVQIKRMKASNLVRERLSLDNEDEEIIQFKRVRFRNEQSFSFIVNYLPIEIGERITKQQLYEKHLLQILEQDFGIQFDEAFQTVEASFADREVSKKLGILIGSPLLYVERIMHAEKWRKPVTLSQASYRGDLFKYIIRLKRYRRKGKAVWIHDEKKI